MISGLITIAAFVSFIGIAIWAYSSSNRARFEEAEMLPFEDEPELKNRLLKYSTKGEEA